MNNYYNIEKNIIGFQNTDDDKPKKKKKSRNSKLNDPVIDLNSKTDDLSKRTDIINNAIQEFYSYVKIDNENSNVQFNGLESGSLALPDDDSALDWTKDIVSINKNLQVVNNAVFAKSIKGNAITSNSLNTRGIRSTGVRNTGNVTTKTLSVSESASVGSGTFNVLNSKNLSTDNMTSKNVKTSALSSDNLNSTNITALKMRSSDLSATKKLCVGNSCFTENDLKNTASKDSVDSAMNLIKDIQVQMPPPNLTSNNIKLGKELSDTDIEPQILNDRTNRNSLVLVGPKTPNTNERNVSVLNKLNVDGKFCVGKACINEEQMNSVLGNKGNIDKLNSDFTQSQDYFKKIQDNLLSNTTDLQTTQNNLKTTRDDLKTTNDDLKTTRDDLKTTRDDLKTTKNTVQKIQSEVSTTNGDLFNTKSEIDSTIGNLQKVQFDVIDTKGTLNKTQSELKSTVGNLLKVQFDVTDTKGTLNKTQSEFSSTLNNLQKVQLDVSDTKGILDKTQSELSSTLGSLQKVQLDVTATKGNLDKTQNDVNLNKNLITQTQSDINLLNNKNLFNSDLTVKGNLIYGVDGKTRLSSDGSINAGSINGTSITASLNNRENITNPTANTRINARGIQFGGTNSGYDVNSAQISAGLHAQDSLNIVGMGRTDNSRKIDMWSEGRGTSIHGSLVVDNDQTVSGNSTVSGDQTVRGVLIPSTDKWHKTTDGKDRLYFGGNSHTFYKTGDAHIWRNNANQDKMNLDANGNLTVDGNSTVKGSIDGNSITASLNNWENISNPTANTRINARGIQFGGTNNGNDSNSAQISAGVHVPDSLCIVGMGKTNTNRKIDMWSEGGTTINGNLVVKNNQDVNGKLTVKNGSQFTGDRHFFQDVEGKGRLRVGAAWGIPGIYAENGSDLVLGAESGNVNIGGVGSKQNLNVTGILTTGGQQVNVIFPVQWDHQWWTARMATYFKRAEPDGTKKEFLLVHPGDMNNNHSLRWTAYFIGIKQGIQVYFFEPHIRHEGVPNPATPTNASTDFNWRRVIPD